MSVNPDCLRPQVPHDWWWLTEHECIACEEQYKRWHPGVLSFADAVQELRAQAKASGDPGGGFRSRGPVLWRMHCAKMAAWILRHQGCEPF